MNSNPEKKTTIWTRGFICIMISNVFANLAMFSVNTYQNEEKVNINDYEDEAKRHLVYELFSKPSTVKKLAKKTYNAVVNGRLIGSCCKWRYAKSLITCCEKEYAIAGIGINSKYIYQTFKVNI